MTSTNLGANPRRQAFVLRGANPMRKALAAVAAVLLACMLAGCSQGAGPASGSTVEATGSAASGAERGAVRADDTWTLLVYMCGSNLESMSGLATDNIIELQSVDIPSNVNVVLETGGADEWQNNLMDAEYLERYTMEGGKLYLQDQLPRASMGAAGTFADFMKWGVKNYPADHYMLVFWDHGGGSLSGVCQDELDYDTLTLPEIAAGLKSSGAAIDVVGFDTCLMATLETAQILAPYADYMVASEEVEPGGGWAWAEWPAWFANPKGGIPGLGALICDSYMEKCEDYGVADTATLSVVDLGAISEVAAAFATASEGMATATEEPTALQVLVGGGREVEAFGHADYLKGYTDMVDLGDLMACMDESLGAEAEAVAKAVDDAVVYEVHGPYRAKATGLSVFYPLNIDEDTFRDYFALSTENDLDNVAYLQYLAVRTGAYDIVTWGDSGVAGLAPVEEKDAARAIAYTSEIDANGRYNVRITDGGEWVTVTTFSVGQVLDDGTVAMLGSDNDMDLKIDSVKREVTYTDRFQGYWFKIGSAYAYADIVEMVADGDEASYNLYSTPVELTTKNNKGNEVTVSTNLLSMYSYKSGKYKVLCVYDDADESGMAGKTTRALKEGDKLRFLVSRQVDGKVQGGSTGTITWTADTEMTKSYAGNATYVYLAEITDLFGNTYRPDPAIITFEDGNRTATLGKLN